MDSIVERITKWFREHYNVNIDYSTMTIYIKKK